MIEKLFPRQVTNEYSGTAVAHYFFIFMTLVTIARSLAHILLPDGGAQSIATIPLDEFTVNGAATAVHVFALWGLSQLLLGLLYVVVLWRYRSLIPLMILLMVAEYAGRLLLTFAKPIETHGTAPGAIGNYIIIPLALVMLVLSLKKK